MFTDVDLKDLVAFRSDQSSVLSLYLNVDPTQQTTDQYKLVLRSLLRKAAGEAEPADVQALERYFDFEYAWQGRGVAAFSCHSQGFWRVFSLAVPVANRVHVNHRPYLKPLTDVLDAYGRYGVLVVDREGGRMFLFHLGELVDATGTMGEEVRRVKHGGASGVAGMRGGRAARLARRGEAVVQRNLKDVAEAANAFCTDMGITRLLLAGSEQNLSRFQEMLPKNLQDRVVGTFALDIGASVAEVQARSTELIERTAAQREAERVEEMIARWKRGSGAAVGLSDALAVLQERRAGLLLVSAGYEASGFRCQSCRFLVLTERKECPLCGGSMERVEDLVESMVHRALEQGTEVEIVRGNAALEEAGSIGALLRY